MMKPYSSLFVSCLFRASVKHSSLVHSRSYGEHIIHITGGHNSPVLKLLNQVLGSLMYQSVRPSRSKSCTCPSSCQTKEKETFTVPGRCRMTSATQLHPTEDDDNDD
ncbi:uncharacterized protein LOC142219942 isoform X2 [Haematobia irritans]|uniref:uncharacterized protein LOC142219942 isoform X2 n=1 Tax=Haematobia irritans TaxID=7368 RepID=UPI003F4F70EA